MPHFIADENPNEHFGVRACTFADQQKSLDCGGKWFVMQQSPTCRVANPRAPFVCVCAKHLQDAVALTAPRPRNKRTRTKLDEVPSL